jgi:AcrR family transcriptional regulator
MSTDSGRDTVGSVWGRHHGRPARRPALTREAIVEVAMKVADAEGLAAVSMRRIAAELDARVMSLYHHVARKEDLLALMGDAAAGEVLVPEPLPDDWREAIMLIAKNERAAAQRHPWMGDLVSVQLEVGPNMLRHGEQTVAALAPLDLPLQEGIEVSLAIDHYVLGHTLRERWNLFAEQDGGHAIGAAEVLRGSPAFEQLREAGEIPRLTALMRQGIPRPSVDTFEQGLRWLLDGIERDVVAPRRAAAAAAGGDSAAGDGTEGDGAGEA